ncbi:flippase-like domain-containing protein [Pseudolysobacter antarcticus]|uniref:Flippase-like domain-containing protein n=1 Tax=Pseudolysobacter antarcticus TaxID=2511995 RepID=A0A411HJA8_9GAMM|nr:lysylphosphatidylglycerol synthase transmembrane domain-containing protein [Pseudolysobacter antarcticus]QBB70583.1 flippase-like domain-containing protein [Pseudolysobacter antarcticus]
MNLRFWLKLVLSTCLLGWLLQRTPLGDVTADLTRVGLGIFIAGALLSLQCWIDAAIRLWVVAPEFPLTEVVRMSFISQFYGTVLPGQLAGDVVKIWRLGRFQRFPGHAAAATLIDRGIATFALFAIGAFAAFALDTIHRSLGIVLVCATFAIAIAGVMLSLASVRDLLVRLANIGSSRPWLARLSELLHRIAHALHDAMRRPARLMICFILALVFHAICIGNHMLIGHALGIDIGLSAWCLVYAGVSVLMLLPISIAGIGLREGGYVGLLALFGTSRETALALSFTFLGYALLGALLGYVTELMDYRDQ